MFVFTCFVPCNTFVSLFIIILNHQSSVYCVIDSDNSIFCFIVVADEETAKESLLDI